MRKAIHILFVIWPMAFVSLGYIMLLLPSCTKKKESLPITSDSILAPYQEFEKSELYFYDGQYKRWVLRCEKMRKPIADTASLVGAPVHLSLFDTNGRVGSIVLADSGCAPPSMNKFTIWGNVYVRTFDSLKIYSERLWWSQQTHKVESDTFVQIETPKGDRLMGKGLVAEEDFSRWTLKQDVKGYFPNFKKRIEENEEF